MKNPKLKLGVLYSSGKDSNYATYLMQQEGHSIECLITVKSKNQDSYMFHTPNIDFSRMQSEAMDIALIEEISKGEEEIEIEDMKSAIKKAQERYLIEGVVTGALYSSYQKDRIERICNELGLEVFSPLWHIDQEAEMRKLLELGFEFIFSSVAAYGLNKDWLGKIITDKQIDKLVRLNEKVGLNIAGEGGEFESFVIDSPMYNKRIEIKDYEIVERDEYTAHLIIKDAELLEK
ncbi:diphthine--ammonia ligase [Methanohalobium sp.]|uniref:diphthine--ammonia ligase n=1 Tax=Methanohalobium sp. TaxID=2837493 RepID=UPI0025F9344D|nr:diphthine--ammonia ligase [Methanohalobium sp.]